MINSNRHRLTPEFGTKDNRKASDRFAAFVMMFVFVVGMESNLVSRFEKGKILLHTDPICPEEQHTATWSLSLIFKVALPQQFTSNDGRMTCSTTLIRHDGSSLMLYQSQSLMVILYNGATAQIAASSSSFEATIL